MSDRIFPTFHVMPESVLERWKLIRRFTENWDHISLNVESAVCIPPLPPNDFSVEYPTSFVEWFRFSHDLKAAGSMRLRGGDNIVTEAVPGYDAISLMSGGEGDRYWGVVYSDLRYDDPPVRTFVLSEDSGEGAFVDAGMVCESITEFVLLKLAYRVFPLSWLPSASVTNDRVQRMLSEFESHASLGGLQIFESPSVVAVMDRDGTLIIGMEKSVQRSCVPKSVAELLW
jgi:hypothetical protein